MFHTSIVFALLIAAVIVCAFAEADPSQLPIYPELIRCTQPKNKTAKAVTELPSQEGIALSIGSSPTSGMRKLHRGLILPGKGPASATFTWRILWRPNKSHPVPPERGTAMFSYQLEHPNFSKELVASREVPVKYRRQRNGDYVAEVTSPPVSLEGRVWVVPFFHLKDMKGDTKQ